MNLLAPVSAVIVAVAMCCGLMEGSDAPPVEPLPIDIPAPPSSPPVLPMPSVTEPAAVVPAPGVTPVAAEPSGGGTTTAVGMHEGTLASSSGTTVTLTTTGGDNPPVGAKGSLSKWVKKNVMGMEMTMWLGIGNVTVTAVSASSVTLTVDEVTFDATVNGKKVDPFAEKGAKTQLQWTK